MKFAEFLLQLVREEFDIHRVAVLWAQKNSNYYLFWPGVDVWDRKRDANKYNGPWPIIAHPPCGSWGRYKAVCFDPRIDGINAMKFVHQFGGIVEQPVGSKLFVTCGDRRGEIILVNQGDFGHLALKPTLLYFVRRASLPQETSEPFYF